MPRIDIVQTTTVTIGAGASLSEAADLQQLGQLVGIVTAATWDAAKITFQASYDGTNWFTLRYNGIEYEVASITGTFWEALNPAVFAGVEYVKVRSGTSGAAVNQADASIVTLICRAV